MMLSRKIYLKNLPIGGGSAISVQTMTKLPTRDYPALAMQIRQLIVAGADVIRVSVKFNEDVPSLARVVKEFDVPIVADIHFNYRLAIEAIKAGCAGIRLNPGNISDGRRIKEILKAVEDFNPSLVIRVGINSGSLPEGLADMPAADAMVKAAQRYISLLEDRGFFNIKVSLKSSDVMTTIRANEMFRNVSDYPLHIGVTATGDMESGIVKSSIGIGALLSRGIGDTLRVSLSGPPMEEVKLGRSILRFLGMGQGVDIIACPTCGRAYVDAKPLVQELKGLVEEFPDRFSHISRIAVMGCEVNGPGEAMDADIGVACAKGYAIIFRNGRALRRVKESDIMQALLEEVDALKEVKD